MDLDGKDEAKATGKDITGSRWRQTGLADVNAHGISPTLLSEIVEEREKSNKDKVLLVPSASSVKMVDKCTPDVFPGAFPTLFPYGIGGPAQPRRNRIALSNFAMHCMRLADRRFSTHPPFVFTIFNLVQQLRVSRSASRSLRAGYFLDFSKDLVHLSTDAIKQCIKDLKAVERNGKYPTLNHCKDKQTRKALLAMFRHVNTIGGRLLLTDASKRNARHEAIGMDIKLGMPDFFITINPEDRHSPLVCHFAGHSLQLRLSDPAFPDGLPTCKERKRLIANDSLSAVHISHTLLRAFIQSLLGVPPPGSPPSAQPLGVLGDVIGYHFNPEEQGRGSLHYHGMVWLRHKPDVETFRELLETPEFRKHVLSYLQSVIKQEEPTLWPKDELEGDVQLAGDQHIERVFCKLCSQEHAVMAGKGSESTAERRNADDHPSCQRIADPTADDSDSQFLGDCQELASLVRFFSLSFFVSLSMRLLKCFHRSAPT